jgi:alpha-L-rhamnosidase
MDDYAYRILFNEECPGWIYCINLGATTIWERWNSLLSDGTISGINMNSFNHYSYGSVCEAIYSRIGGLRNMSKGWKKVLIKPQINYRLKNVKLNFESIRGKFEIKWEIKENKFYLDVVIPNGVEAEIILPDKTNYDVKEGKYNYECEIEKKIYSPFSIDTPLIDIIKNAEASKIVKETLPQAYEMATGENDEFKLGTIRHLSSLMMFMESKDKVKKCDEELQKIKF